MVLVRVFKEIFMQNYESHIIMKQAYMLQLIVISTFLSCAFTYSETANPTNNNIHASQEAEIAQLAEFAKILANGAFDALQKIESKLTEVALLMKKGLVKKGSNPVMIMNVITENKMLINSLLQGQATIIALKDPVKQLEIAFFIAEFSRAFTHYFEQQITNGFKDAKPFNINRFVKRLHKTKTRSNLSHLEPNAIAQSLNKTMMDRMKLDITVQNIGLTWYNKLARKLDSWVVTPANQWHVPTIGTYVGASSILASYLLWSYGYLVLSKKYVKDFLDKKGDDENIPWTEINAISTDSYKDELNTPIWLQNLIIRLNLAFKGPIVINPRTAHYEFFDLKKMDDYEDDLSNINPKKTLPDGSSPLAATDFMLKDLLSNHNPFALMTGSYFLKSAYDTLTAPNGFRDRLLKRRDDWWNFLRGGEYLNTEQPGLVMMTPTTTFKDMVGMDSVKEEFLQILQYVSNPEQFRRLGAEPEKGWLLTGPSRTGKSFSVECLFGEIKAMMAQQGDPDKMKFISLTAAMLSQWSIKDIMMEIQQMAPAVVFIDEIDLLGLNRVTNAKLLSEFLTTMQSSMNGDPSKVVIVIAATNMPHHLDFALRQNGRLGKEIRFKHPSKKYRKELIVKELTNMAVNLKEFDTELLANKTKGKTFEDLKRVIRTAMTRSWMLGISLSQDLLEECIDTELHGIIKNNTEQLPERELRVIATHFAGRGLAALHLETHDQLDKITIYPYMTKLKDSNAWEEASKKDTSKEEQKKIEYGLCLWQQANDTIDTKDAATILNEIVVTLAGFAAEELLLGKCGFMCHGTERDEAYQALEKFVFGGLNEEKLAKSVREELKNKTYGLFRECHERATTLLKEHQEALIAVVEELLKKQMLNTHEMKAIIDKAEGRIAPVDEHNDIFNDSESEEKREEEEESQENAIAIDLEDSIDEVIIDDVDDSLEAEEVAN